MTVVPPRLVNSEVVANAGPDQFVKFGQTVTLIGSIPSGVNKTIRSYTWRQLSGVTVTLSNTSIASPIFTAPNYHDTLIFGLVLEYTDGTFSSEDIVNIYINRNVFSFWQFRINSATTSTAVNERTLTFTKINNEILNIYFSVFILMSKRYIPTTTMNMDF